MQPSTLDTIRHALEYWERDVCDDRETSAMITARVEAAIAELERARPPINSMSYIIDNILWDYNSPLGEAAFAVRSWLLKQTGRTSSSPTAGE